ncbi:Uncharacterized protein Fot_27745 [Forsythia ovata]|uniref:Uncharacterized protein n=1 Tax=Forsythia ovata TaxID=205694 RepID=A0ABD1TM80_9LAMI
MGMGLIPLGRSSGKRAHLAQKNAMHLVANPKLAVHQKSARIEVKGTNRLAEVLLQCANQSSSKDNELLEHLVEIGVENDDELLNAQTLLLQNPTKLRVFYSFSVHRHESWLMKMFQNVAK